MTDTRLGETSSVAPAHAAPAERPGLAGWLTTSDHKRIGRLYIACALAFLVVGGLAGQVLAGERIDEGFDLVSSGAYTQLHTFHGEVALWLFLVPLLLGLATVVVPLQVGSPEIAFPRGAATGFWSWLVGGALLIGAYAADGGPSGDDAVAVDLHLLALAAIVVALGLGVVCVVTTVLTMRAPGMTLDRVPAFSWSLVVAGGLTLLTAPVLLARLVVLFVTHHFGGDYGAADYGAISWAFSVPQVYLAVVPAAGIALEVVPVLARNRLRVHGAALVVISLLGVVGLGAWAQAPGTFDELLYVAIGLAAVVPALALLGLLGDTLRSGRPVLKAPLLFAMGSVLMLLAGAGAGALSVIDGLDLRGTVWEAGQLHLVLAGAGWLGALAGLWWWAPKVWGRTLSEGLGMLTFLATFAGVLLLGGADLVNGLANDVPLGGDAADGGEALAAISAVGGLLVVAGAVVALVAILTAARRRTEVPADPWGGFTLEWATTSPPAPGNFSVPIPAVASATPLLDEVDA